MSPIALPLGAPLDDTVAPLIRLAPGQQRDSPWEVVEMTRTSHPTRAVAAWGAISETCPPGEGERAFQIPVCSCYQTREDLLIAIRPRLNTRVMLPSSSLMSRNFLNPILSSRVKDALFCIATVAKISVSFSMSKP